MIFHGVGVQYLQGQYYINYNIRVLDTEVEILKTSGSRKELKKFRPRLNRLYFVIFNRTVEVVEVK